MADTLSIIDDRKKNNFDVFRVEVERLDTLSNPQLLPKTYTDIQLATSKDPDLVQLAKVISSKWPDKRSQLSACLKPYWCSIFRDELSVPNGIIYCEYIRYHQ